MEVTGIHPRPLGCRESSDCAEPQSPFQSCMKVRNAYKKKPSWRMIFPFLPGRRIPDVRRGNRRSRKDCTMPDVSETANWLLFNRPISKINIRFTAGMKFDGKRREENKLRVWICPLPTLPKSAINKYRQRSEFLRRFGEGNGGVRISIFSNRSSPPRLRPRIPLHWTGSTWAVLRRSKP